MKRQPPVVKKELVGLRRTLAGAEKRYEHAEAELRRVKKTGNASVQVDAEMKLQEVQREIDQTKRAIRAAEEELVGDWRPKACGSLSDAE